MDSLCFTNVYYTILIFIWLEILVELLIYYYTKPQFGKKKLFQTLIYINTRVSNFTQFKNDFYFVSDLYNVFICAQFLSRVSIVVYTEEAGVRPTSVCFWRVGPSITTDPVNAS